VTENPSNGAAPEETILGRAIVEMNLATSADLAECIEEQKRLAAEGAPRSLADLLLEKGV